MFLEAAVLQICKILPDVILLKFTNLSIGFSRK